MHVFVCVFNSVLFGVFFSVLLQFRLLCWFGFFQLWSFSSCPVHLKSMGPNALCILVLCFFFWGVPANISSFYLYWFFVLAFSNAFSSDFKRRSRREGFAG